MRKTLLILLLAMTVPSHRAASGDSLQAVTAVWSDFTSALRRGDYRGAHSLFSAESQAALPYYDFVAEYGPLTAAREMAAVQPESLSARRDGDWAQIVYGGISAGTRQPFRVAVSLTRNAGGWQLVAARNEPRERLEAQARDLLRHAAGWRGRPGARERTDEMLRAAAGSPLLRAYRIETDGDICRAVPLRAGLRTFYADARGDIRAVGEKAAPAAAASAGAAPLPELQPLPPPPVPAARPSGSMPELTEPPPFAGFAGMPGEMAEPPAADRGWNLPASRTVPAAAAPVRLPDRIE